MMLFSRSLVWLSIANILLSSALVPMTARLTWLLTGFHRVAIVAAWVVALNPTFVFFAPVLASEHLFAALLVAALIVTLSIPRGDRFLLPVIGAGALIGAAALARADAMFYVPVFAVLAWWRTSRRALAPAALLLSVAVVLAPWYIRNRIVIGPGAGVSTAGGLTFYYAHNDRTYGYHPLRGTPLEGLDEAAMQTRGYQLGLEYLSHAPWSRIISDIGTATRLQFVPSYPFSLVWATQSMGKTPDDMTQRPLPGFDAFFRLAELAYYALLCGAALSLTVFRRYPRAALCVLWGVIGINWFAHCVIFLGEGRYRYPAELMCCMLVALLVAAAPRRI